MISLGNADKVFTQDGYNNWKSATEKKKGFRKHETSASHQEAVARYLQKLLAMSARYCVITTPKKK